MMARLSSLGQVAAMLIAWTVLRAATSSEELMPLNGRAQPFGKNAEVVLVPASDQDESTFGERPKLTDDFSIEWRLQWNGQAYDVFDDQDGESDKPEGTMALRKLRGTRHLYVAQFWEPGTSDSSERSDENYEYFLMWRLSRHEYIGYLNLFWLSYCGDVPKEKLVSLGMTDDDIENCNVHDWQQVEGVMRAYAKTNPKADGTMRKK